ncbi:hypothetical protein GCM10012319_28200 [Comamonas sp. KCTC 72670]|nr:hypothetical protein GCM10012319_28200 [Comamonas sp. KCTC 72670]
MPRWEGQPFTGCAFDCFKNGALCSEDFYFDGARHGPSRIWRAPGDLAEELLYWQGIPHGIPRTWREGGQLATERKHELGFLVAEHKWDEEGVLVLDWVLTPQDWRFALLERKRKDLGADAPPV